MADGWVILPPTVQEGPKPVNFPAIDKVRGEGGAARMIQARQRLGGYGFADETVGPLTDEIGAGVSAAVDYARGGINALAGYARGEAPKNSAGLGELYADHAAIIRADREAYRAEHPTAAATANVLGGLSMLPAKGVAAAQGLWETAKTGAKVGA
ncbi:hypothetical protein CNY89_17155, partial [Amaricoccus sp. HAR-UPW-R2A-40]